MTGVQACPIAHPVAWRPVPHPTCSGHVPGRLRARTVALFHAHSVTDLTLSSRSALAQSVLPLVRSGLGGSSAAFARSSPVGSAGEVR